MLTGGCHCGAIRYTVEAAPFHRTLCHCTLCRATTGAPCVAWFTVPLAAFHLQGAPARYHSSDHGTRGFCATCGTQLTFSDAGLPDEIDVSTGSLDDPAAAAPTSHIHTASQLPWLQFSDGLPVFAGSRGEQEK